MGNCLAIATTTATIGHLLKDINKDVPGAIVTTKPLDLATKKASDSLNIFLYQVTPNAAYKNLPPERLNADGKRTRNPLALNLHYLLTALTADNDDLKAQKILASALSILYGNPVLTKEMISATIQDNPKIAGSDLAEQSELIKLTPQPLSTDELSKFWASLFKFNYRISVAYQASVILLDGKQEG